MVVGSGLRPGGRRDGGHQDQGVFKADRCSVVAFKGHVMLAPLRDRFKNAAAAYMQAQTPENRIAWIAADDAFRLSLIHI